VVPFIFGNLHELCPVIHELFDIVSTFWKRSDSEPEPPKVYPDGHPVISKDANGKSWLYFNGPPDFKCPATYEGWKDRSQWQHFEAQMEFKDGSR